MNTAPDDACQTHRRLSLCRAFGHTVACLLAALVCTATPPVKGQVPATVAPAATPLPAWQQELDAASLLEASLLAAPAQDPAEAARRDERLSGLYQRLADKYPDRAAVQKAWGESASRRGRITEALQAFRRAEILDPGDADTASLLGAADLQMGHTREASAQLQQAVRLAPNDPHTHFALANVLYLFRHDLIAPPLLPDEKAVLAQALGEFRRTTELAPRDLAYAQAYAETFYNVPQPDWEQARTAWKAVLALSGESTDFANSHLARVSLRMKRPADVDAYLSLLHDPAFAGLKANLHAQAAKLPPAAP